MKKKELKLRIITVLVFMIYVLLTIKFSNGSILNLQGYLNLQLISFVFWSFIILVCIILLIADTGFLKIGAVLGIIIGFLIPVFLTINNTSSYEVVSSDKYQLVVETVESDGNGKVNVYMKDNLFFSVFVGSFLIDDYFDTSYEIVGDSLIVTMCSTSSCITDEIDLE